MKFCCYEIWQGNYCASVIVNFEKGVYAVYCVQVWLTKCVWIDQKLSRSSIS